MSLLKRIYYGYLGYFYGFTYYTSTRRFLGVRLSTLIVILTFLLLGVGLFYRWDALVLYLLLALIIWMLLAYQFAKLSGYFRFVPANSEHASEESPQKLAPYQRVPVKATGVFSVQDWEKGVLLRPADYWQVPRGDHAVMVEYEPRRFLYQFFDSALVREIRPGWLLHGPRPSSALSISFSSIWGPELSEVQLTLFGTVTKPAAPKTRTIFLSFGDDQAEQLVYQNILSDMA